MSDIDAIVAQNTRAFALERLNDREFLEWAVALRLDQIAERSALKNLLELRINEVEEPYRQAWLYLLEYWDGTTSADAADRLSMKQELKLGTSATETIKLIVEAVRPRIKVESGKKYEAFGRKRAKRPKSVADIFWVSMDGGEMLTPEELCLAQINDRDYLFALATSLNNALLSGLNQAQQMGMISNGADFTLWLVRRVYFVPESQFAEGQGEPDRYREGFAPTTKLLFAVFERLSEIDQPAALRLLSSWDVGRWKLYKRLWAAAARDENFVSDSHVGQFFATLDDMEFWSSNSFPEFAELRAVRWSSLAKDMAALIEQRLVAGEPIARIKKQVGKHNAKDVVRRSSIEELQRIKAGGGQLSKKTESWLARSLKEYPPVTNIASVTDGFDPGVRNLIEDRSSDPTFADIPTSKLIDEIGRYLSDDGWGTKSHAAMDFVGRNPELVLNLLAIVPVSNASQKVWQAVGYNFRPSDLNATIETVSQDDKALIPIAEKTCMEIARLDKKTIEYSLPGLSAFMLNWNRLLKGSERFVLAWLALWPLAVSKCNQDLTQNVPLVMRIDSSPVSRLVSAFMQVCPTFAKGSKPFAAVPWSNALVAIENATGEAKLQAQHRLLRDLTYFWAADEVWSRRNLLAPLLLASGDSIELWHGFVQEHVLVPRALLAELGEKMIAAAAGNELVEEVRGSLSQRAVLSIIIDMRDRQSPAIPAQLIQQMLRMGGDAVRTRALEAMKKYLRGIENTLEISDERFRLVKKVFELIWPKEVTLSSPALSKAFADFPAAAGNNYAEAAQLVLPYLMPFQCWSLFDYGVLDPYTNDRTISGVNSAKDAECFLAVLDRTIGTEDRAIIPRGLDRALAHIVKKHRKSVSDTRYQRLLTLSRR